MDLKTIREMLSAFGADDAIPANADEAISRVLHSAALDEAVDAFKQVWDAKESGADEDTILEVFHSTAAIARWETFKEATGNLADQLGWLRHLDDSKNDAKKTMFLTEEHQPLEYDPPFEHQNTPYWSEVVRRNLSDHTSRMLRWLETERTRCKNHAAKVKHDEFIKFCYNAVGEGEPPASFLALPQQQHEESASPPD